MAHTGSATGLDHSLDAPVVCKVFKMCTTMLFMRRSRVRGSEIKLSQDGLGMHKVPSRSRCSFLSPLCGDRGISAREARDFEI
eukprot:5560719-Pleurochrysis_carterae.AAC.1